MAAIFMTPLYILANMYVVRWMLLWLGACSCVFQSVAFQAIFVGLYILPASALLTGFLITRPAGLHRFLKRTGDYFLGILLYVILIIGVADLGRLILKYILHAPFVERRSTFVIMGLLCLILILTVNIYGILHVETCKVTPYEVFVDKKVRGATSLKVVLLADMHFGHGIVDRNVWKLADLVNKQKPDLVCVAGDIFDNDYSAIQNPEEIKEALRSIRSRYGTYACWGNHDLDEPILAGFTFGGGKKDKADPRMEELLQRANIRLLTDEALLIDGKFYLIGRDDPSRIRKLGEKRLSPIQLTEELDKGKPIILMDHQPRELEEAARAGVDLDLCGHTHAGQIFPGNLLTRLLWENRCGYLKKGSMHNIVTSGAGGWGPDMRVGTSCEICTITMRFAKYSE